MLSRTLTQAGSERRRQILEAALASFTELGFARASVDDIRRRSGASVGSIYHFFGSKDEIAAALYLEGLRDYHDGLHAHLRRKRGAAALVKGVVTYHLGWIETHPAWARFLNDMRRAESVGAVEAEIRALTKTSYRALFAQFAPHVDEGRITRLPNDEFVSVVFGPAHEYARLWLRKPAGGPLREAAARLAEAAWRAVRSQPRG